MGPGPGILTSIGSPWAWYPHSYGSPLGLGSSLIWVPLGPGILTYMSPPWVRDPHSYGSPEPGCSILWAVPGPGILTYVGPLGLGSSLMWAPSRPGILWVPLGLGSSLIWAPLGLGSSLNMGPPNPIPCSYPQELRSHLGGDRSQFIANSRHSSELAAVPRDQDSRTIANWYLVPRTSPRY